MAYEATPAAARALSAVRGATALRAAWRVFWPSRMAVLLVAVFAALSFGPATGGPGGRQPLMSLPRFLAVLFGVFMWLAAWIA